jgi:hypothetical protein
MSVSTLRRPEVEEERGARKEEWGNGNGCEGVLRMWSSMWSRGRQWTWISKVANNDLGLLTPPVNWSHDQVECSIR